MNRSSWIWLAGALLLFCLGNDAPAQPADASSLSITGTNAVEHPRVNGLLKIQLSDAPSLDPSKYALFIDGRRIDGLDETLHEFDGKTHTLVFRLRRNASNASVWKALLGSPTGFTRRITVGLAAASSPTAAASPTIIGDGKTDTLDLTVISRTAIVVAAIVAVLMGGIVWYSARHTTLLKDNLLPQIPSSQQTYSLGRWQMAFWFVLIAVVYVVLFVVLDDLNTITPQTLWLMGVSGATGGGAIAVDVFKDTPSDAANRGLQALGLKAYEDVEKVRAEIADKQKLLEASPPPHPRKVKQLSAEIRDRQLLLTTYENRVAQFLTKGWFSDLTTDLNGASLHRLQVFCWTWILGAVFIYGVYTDLAMPSFNSTLLLLLGISGAGYVGFKYPEPQN